MRKQDEKSPSLQTTCIDDLSDPSADTDRFSDTTSLHSVERWLEQTVTSCSPTSTSVSVSNKTSTSTLVLEQQGTCGQKRKRSLLPEEQASLRLPLTTEAVKRHMAAQGHHAPVTPGLSSSSGTPQDLSSVVAKTPGPKSNPTDSQIKRYLEQHGMSIDKGLLRKPEHKDFRKLVYKVCDTERPSGMKQKSVDKLYHRPQTSQAENERTMLTKVLPCIIKDARKMSATDPDGEVVITDEDFDSTGLDLCEDQEFIRTYMPNTYKDMGFDKDLAEALQKAEKVRNPKPDRIYGLTPETLAIPEGDRIRGSTLELMEIVPTLHHCFWLLEGKSSNGSLTRAMYQACGGGTTCVSAQRELLDQTGQNNTEVEGIDQRTYIYSTTLDANLMIFWVHFAIVKLTPDGSKAVTYHMEQLRSIAYRDEGNPEILRRICHNILEWGTCWRDKQLRERCDNVWKYERAFFKNAVALSHQEAAQKKEELRLRLRRADASAAKKRKIIELGMSVESSSSRGLTDDVFA